MQPKRLQLRERVAFIHEFVLPNSNNTAEMQPYEPNQAKSVVLCKLKTIECVFAPLHPFLFMLPRAFFIFQQFTGKDCKECARYTQVSDMRFFHIDTSARTLSGSGTWVAILPGKLRK